MPLNRRAQPGSCTSCFSDRLAKAHECLVSGVTTIYGVHSFVFRHLTIIGKHDSSKRSMHLHSALRLHTRRGGITPRY